MDHAREACSSFSAARAVKERRVRPLTQHGSCSTDREAVVFARTGQSHGACSRAVCMDFWSSMGRVLSAARGVFLGSTERVLYHTSSKSEVGNSDCFVVFSNWKNELCDSDLSNLIEKL